MKELTISRKELVKDREYMSVDDIKEKYGLNNASYYKILQEFGLTKRAMSERKKIILVD